MSASGTQALALSVAGGRGRAACARMAEVGDALASALRRAVPFLARRRVPVTAEAPMCIPFSEIAADSRFVHASPCLVRSADGGSVRVRGLVLLDDEGLARVLDGVLGGDGKSRGDVESSGAPTAAQQALATRVTTGMLRLFADAVGPIGLTLEPTAAKDVEAGTAVVVTLAIDGGGRVVLAIPLSAIRVEDSERPEEIDSGIASALTDVELDVVAELGKVRLSLATIAGLKVGDVLRLSLPLDERARISSGGSVLFQGRPTASGDLVAVAIEKQIPV